MKHFNKGRNKKKSKGKGKLKRMNEFISVNNVAGRNLVPVNWDAFQLVGVTKNCYQPPPNVTRLTVPEVMQFREANNVSVFGVDLPPILSFKDANFDEQISATIEKLGYVVPTPIQAQGWPYALNGLNIVGIAETGSGKSLAFLLPAIVHVRHQHPVVPGDGPIALVMAPTRELALQIKGVADKFTTKVTAVYGGGKREEQIGELQQGSEMIIGTPGRILDLLQSGVTNFRRTSFLVLDEADRMLDMGFEDQIRRVLNQVRPDRQLLMWSATWPKSVQKLAHDFLGEFSQIVVGNKNLTANHNITQIVKVVHEFEKQEQLIGIIRSLKAAEPGPLKTLVFANTKRLCNRIHKLLKNEQYPCGVIHGDKSQRERNKTLQKFIDGQIEILVASDVAARGLDVNDIKFVINFDFPPQIEDYVHRIGRTGRQQKKGTAYTLFGGKNVKHTQGFIEILREAGQHVPPELEVLLTTKEDHTKDQSCEERFGSRSFFSVG